MLWLCLKLLCHARIKNIHLFDMFNYSRIWNKKSWKKYLYWYWEVLLENKYKYISSFIFSNSYSHFPDSPDMWPPWRQLMPDLWFNVIFNFFKNICGSCNTKPTMEPSEARNALYDPKQQPDDILRSKQGEEKRVWMAARLASLEAQELKRGSFARPRSWPRKSSRWREDSIDKKIGKKQM